MTSMRHERQMGVLPDRLILLLQEPLPLPEPRDSRARAAAEALKRQPGDRRTLREIAREVGASERTLERLFVRETGLNFTTWRLRLRMLAALECLAAGESVGSTAITVGYKNPSSFIAAFRTTFGSTPARYFARREKPGHRVDDDL
jgi:AraC-like DNA-binding protein